MRMVIGSVFLALVASDVLGLSTSRFVVLAIGLISVGWKAAELLEEIRDRLG